MQCWGSWDGPSFGKALRSLSGCSDTVGKTVRSFGGYRDTEGSGSVLVLLSTCWSFFIAEEDNGGSSLLGMGRGSELVRWVFLLSNFGEKRGLDILFCLLMTGFWGVVSCTGSSGVTLMGRTASDWLSTGSSSSGVKMLSCKVKESKKKN